MGAYPTALLVQALRIRGNQVLECAISLGDFRGVHMRHMIGGVDTVDVVPLDDTAVERIEQRFFVGLFAQKPMLTEMLGHLLRCEPTAVIEQAVCFNALLYTGLILAAGGGDQIEKVSDEFGFPFQLDPKTPIGLYLLDRRLDL